MSKPAHVANRSRFLARLVTTQSDKRIHRRSRGIAWILEQNDTVALAVGAVIGLLVPKCHNEHAVDQAVG